MTCSKWAGSIKKWGILVAVMVGVASGVSTADEISVSGGVSGTPAAENALEVPGNAGPVGLDDPWAVAESILEIQAEEEIEVSEAKAEPVSPDVKLAEDDASRLEEPSSEASAPESNGLRPPSLPEADDVERLSATALEGVKTLTLKQGVLIHLEADGLLGEASYFPVEDPERLVID